MESTGKCFESDICFFISHILPIQNVNLSLTLLMNDALTDHTKDTKFKQIIAIHIWFY